MCMNGLSCKESLDDPKDSKPAWKSLEFVIEGPHVDSTISVDFNDRFAVASPRLCKFSCIGDETVRRRRAPPRVAVVLPRVV